MADLDELFGGNETTAEQTQLSKEDWQILREQNRAQAYEMLEEATTLHSAAYYIFFHL